MQISTDLLLDCIFLLLVDYQISTKTSVKDIVALYEEENKTIENPNKILDTLYLRIIGTLLSNKDPESVSSIALKLKSDKAYVQHKDIIDEIIKVMTGAPHEATSLTRTQNILKRIENVITWHRVDKAFRRNFNRLRVSAANPDPDIQAMELQDIAIELEKVGTIFKEANNKAHHQDKFDVINFKDRTQVAKAIKKGTDRNVRGVIKTGLQGLNRALGNSGGFVAGESIVFNALPHHYKSGLLVSCAVWAVTENVLTTDDGTKPMVLLISLENEGFQNLIWAFRKVYYRETKLSPYGLSDQEIENWIVEFFEKFDTSLFIERHLPQNFGFYEYTQRVAFYKSQGYTIKLSVTDYANLMKKTTMTADGPKGASRDLAIRDLYSNMCNFNKTEGITWVTAHPLNRRAQEVAAGTNNAVKRFNIDMLAESLDVEREVDVSIYVYLESNDVGVKYLTVKLNKHRYVDDTPESHKYFAYPFQKEAGIVEDLHERPGYVTDIYAVEPEEEAQFNAMSDQVPVY